MNQSWFFSKDSGSGPGPGPGPEPINGTNYSLGIVHSQLGRGEVYPVNKFSPVVVQNDGPYFRGCGGFSPWAGYFQLPTIEGGGTDEGPALGIAPDSSNIRFTSSLFNYSLENPFSQQISAGNSTWNGDVVQQQIMGGYGGSAPMVCGETVNPVDGNKYLVWANWPADTTITEPTAGMLAAPIDAASSYNIINSNNVSYTYAGVLYCNQITDNSIQFKTQYLGTTDITGNSWQSIVFNGPPSTCKILGECESNTWNVISPPTAPGDEVEWYFWAYQGGSSNDGTSTYNTWLRLFESEAAGVVDKEQCLGTFHAGSGTYIYYKDPDNNKPSWGYISENTNPQTILGDCWNLNGFGTGKFELAMGGYGNFTLVDYSTSLPSLLWIECVDSLNPLLVKAVRISHKTIDLSTAAVQSTSDGIYIMTDTEFLYVNPYNLGDLEESDWIIDLIDLDTSMSITKAARILEVSNTELFDTIWSPANEPVIMLPDGSNNNAVERGADPQWNFKSNKTLPLVDVNTTPANGHAGTANSQADYSQAFYALAAQSLNKNDGSRMIAPLYGTVVGGTWNNAADKRLFVGQGTMDLDTGKMDFDKTWTVPYIVSNPEQWENSITSCAAACAVCSDDSSDPKSGYFWQAVNYQALTTKYCTSTMALFKVNSDGEFENWTIVGEYNPINGSTVGQASFKDDAVYTWVTKVFPGNNGAIGNPTGSLIVKTKKDFTGTHYSKGIIAADEYIYTAGGVVDDDGCYYYLASCVQNRTGMMQQLRYCKLNADGSLAWAKQTPSVSAESVGTNANLLIFANTPAYDDNFLYFFCFNPDNVPCLYKVSKTDGSLTNVWQWKSAQQSVGSYSNGMAQWMDGTTLRVMGGVNYDIYNFSLDMTKNPPEQSRCSIFEIGSQPATERPFGIQKPVNPEYYVGGVNVDNVVLKLPVNQTGVTGINLNTNADSPDATTLEKSPVYNWGQPVGTNTFTELTPPSISDWSLTVTDQVGTVPNTVNQMPDYDNITYKSFSFDNTTWSW